MRIHLAALFLAALAMAGCAADHYGRSDPRHAAIVQGQNASDHQHSRSQKRTRRQKRTSNPAARPAGKVAAWHKSESPRTHGEKQGAQPAPPPQQQSTTSKPAPDGHAKASFPAPLVASYRMCITSCIDREQTAAKVHVFDFSGTEIQCRRTCICKLDCASSHPGNSETMCNQFCSNTTGSS